MSMISSFMEFYSSTGTEENISLQEMIEYDIKSIPSGDQWRAQTPSSEILMPLTVLEGYSNKTDSDLNGDNWMQLSQGSTSSSGGIQENTDPNLLVNPQTGVPVGPRTPVTLTLSQPAVTEMRDSNSSSRQIVNIQPQVSDSQQQQQQRQQQTIRVTQPQFVNINNVMQVVASTTQGQQVLLQGNGSTVSSMSPLRQQLQNIPHLQQQQQQTSVSYATTQQLLTQGLQSPQKITMRSLADPESEKVFPKPVYSYSCLIAMSLKNSDTGCLPVSEIYNFMTENFPYFKTAPDGWKNSVRHNLSLNKCFEKIENPKSNGNTKKGCLWAMNPAKIDKMDEEIGKWRKKDLLAIKRSMSHPEVLEILEKGLGKPSLRNNSSSQQRNSGITPTTTHDNNNTTKLLNGGGNGGSTADSNPVTTAILNGNIRELTTVIKQEPRDVHPQQQQQQQTVNVNANVNVIELKPNATMIKLEPTKMEIDIKDLNNITFNSDDLNALDNSLTLDPALNDLALQNGLFDDLGSEDLNLDALPSSSSPLSFSFTSGISASPITVSTAGTPIKMEGGALGNPPPYLFTNSNGRLPSPPPYTANGQTGSSLQIIRTVSAPT